MSEQAPSPKQGRYSRTGSISLRLPLLVFGALLTTILITLALNQYFTRQGLEELLQANLETLALTQSSFVEQQLRQHVTRVERLAGDDFVLEQIEFANSLYGDLSDAEIQAMLQERDDEWAAVLETEGPTANYPLFNAVVYGILTGNRFTPEINAIRDVLAVESEFLVTDRYGAVTAANRPPRQYLQTGEEWWRQVQATGQLYVNGPRTVIDPDSPLINVVEFATPVFDNEGEIAGVLYSVYDYTTIRELVRQLQSSGSARTALIDKDGNVLFAAASLSLLGQETINLEEATGQLATVVIEETIFGEAEETPYAITVIPMESSVDAIEAMGWHVAATQPESDIVEPINTAILYSVGSVVVSGLFAVGALVFFYIRPLTGDLNRLRDAAEALQEGSLRTQVTLHRRDELGVLASTFNQMAARLRSQIETQEQVIAQRTADLQKRAGQLEATTRVGRAASASLELDTLMADTVNLIRDQFGFYHASIFLLDEERRFAVVRESTGEVGKIMKSRPHRLTVGSNSIVGWTTQHRAPRIANNVGQDAVHFNNPLLPDTQSEVALPLISQNQLLGALDVQSTLVNAFAEDDLAVLQLMADQVAAAIYNARLFAQVQEQARQRRRVIEIWQKLNTLRDPDEIVRQACQMVRAEFDYDGVYIATADESEWRVAATTTITPELNPVLGLTRPVGAGVAGQAILVGKPILISDLADAETYRFDLEWPQAAGEASAPIASGETLSGAVGLLSQVAGRLSQDDVSRLELMATANGSAVATARLLASAERNLEELNRLYRQAALGLAEETDQEYILEWPAPAGAENGGNGEKPGRELQRTIPLVSRGQTIGQIVVEEKAGDWTEEDQSISEAVAGQVALALENSRLFVQTQARLVESEALFNLTNLLTTTLDVHEIYRRAARAFTELLHAGRCALSSWDRDNNLVRDEADFIRERGRQVVNEYETFRTTYALAEHTGTAQVLHTRQPLIRHADDATLETSERTLLLEFGMATSLEVPLVTGNEAIGIVELYRAAGQPSFSQHEIRLAQAMANQAATAINNATLATEARSRVAELSTLYRISETLSLAPDLHAVFDSARREILALTNATGVAVGLLDDSKQWMRWIYVHEYGEELDLTNVPAKPITEGFSGYVVRTQQPILENDITPERMKFFNSEILTGAHAASYMGLPLKVANEIIGVLGIENNEATYAFTEGDVRLMTTIAGPLAIAIQNQRLLEQTQSALLVQSQQSLQLQAAAEVSAAAISILEPEALIQAAVNLIQERFALYYIGLFLVDEITNFAVLRAGTGEAGRIQLAQGHRLAVGGRSLIGGATGDGEPRIVQDVTQAETWRPNPVLPDTRSELALPLRVRGRIIGALTVQSTQPNEFSPELVSVLQTMSDQLATAIDNARLLAQTEAQARRQRLLNEVSTSLHRAADVEKIVEIGLRALSEQLGGAKVELKLGHPTTTDGNGRDG